MHLLRNSDRTRFTPRAISLFVRQDTDIEESLDRDSIKVDYLGKAPGFDFFAFGKISAVIRDYQPHIIHTHLYAFRYMVPTLVSHRGKIAGVHTLHNLAQREAFRKDQMVWSFAFRHLHVTPVAIAEAVQESIREVYGIESPLISNGIPVDDYQLDSDRRKVWRTEHNIQPSDVVMVSLGRLVRQKNQQLILSAMAKIAPRLPFLRCLFVGDGELAEELKRQSARLALQDRVEFLGTRCDIPDILAAADFGILSSDWEGNPLSVMEIMAAGKPMLATAVGGVPDLVPGDAGIVVPPGNEDALADGLFRIASNPRLRASMGVSAQQFARLRFGAAAMTREYEALYESLVLARALPM
jgi:glycosyltransferase involved in cell wall biosynthesis